MQSERITREQYRELMARAHRSRMSKLATMERVAHECGLGEHWLAHNATAGAHYGQPWRGVDYSGVRRIMRLERAMWDASRIIERLVTRRGISWS